MKKIIFIFFIFLSTNVFCQQSREAIPTKDINLERSLTQRVPSILSPSCLDGSLFNGDIPNSRLKVFPLQSNRIDGDSFRFSWGENFYPNHDFFIYRSDPLNRSLAHTARWWDENTLIYSGSDPNSFIDSIPTGEAREYFFRTENYYQYGFIYAGNDVDFGISWGTVLLVIDSDYENIISNELSLTIKDFYADGWGVEVLIVNSEDSVVDIKSSIVQKYNQNNDISAVYLIGNIPIPYSGRYALDGHSDHAGAWPADIYYGDIVEDTDFPSSYTQWTDSIVDLEEYGEYWNLEERLINVPGDGKFDLDYISKPELWVGRLTLSNMPSFSKNEHELTIQYLNKVHEFKHGNTPFLHRAFVMDKFPEVQEGFAQIGYHQSTNVGRCSIDNGDWSELAELDDAEAYLFANGVAGGYYQGLRTWDENTQTHEYHVTTQDYALNEYKAVFQVLFGSYFGDFDNPDNFLKAPLCNPKYGLITFWGGRPIVYLHKMSLGYPIGHIFDILPHITSYKYTVQTPFNGTAKKGLMGDPTLKFYYFNSTQINYSKNLISWNPSPEAIGYEVYRIDGSLDAGKKPEILFSFPKIRTSFYLFNGNTGDHYMLREIRIQETNSGTFINRGMGTFVKI